MQVWLDMREILDLKPAMEQERLASASFLTRIISVRFSFYLQGKDYANWDAVDFVERSNLVPSRSCFGQGDEIFMSSESLTENVSALSCPS